MVEEAVNGDSLLVLDAVDQPSTMAEEAPNSSGADRRSRQEWWTSGGESSRRRSRSRSPVRRGKRNFGRGGEDGIGNKTNSEDPYLQRARLFVGNIDSAKVTRRDLVDLFSQYGKVFGVSIHKGYAFVQMDRERNANRAVISEDNQMFHGSKLHVEFSSAALKAGARLLPVPPSPPPPMRERERDFNVMHSLEAELEHEERLARILDMERDLAYIRAREDIYTELYTRSQMDAAPYDRPREDPYRRPPHSPTGGYGPQREYGLDRQERLDDRRHYYRSEPASSLSRQPPDARMELLSYPLPRTRTGPRADPLASAYGGSTAGLSPPTVGYGGGGGGGGSYGSGKPRPSGGNPPPGWPTPGGYQRGNNSRGPFSSGYWN